MIPGSSASSRRAMSIRSEGMPMASAMACSRAIRGLESG